MHENSLLSAVSEGKASFRKSEIEELASRSALCHLYVLILILPKHDDHKQKSGTVRHCAKHRVYYGGGNFRLETALFLGGALN